MKKIYLFLSLLFLFGIGLQTEMKAQDLDFVVKLDTAKCSTSADTIDWYITKPMHFAGQFEYSALADSLSGSTGGTLYVYTAGRKSDNIADWFLDTSYTINGVQTKIQLQDRIYHKYIRFRAIFPSSTQQTKLRQWFTYKPDR